MADPDPAEGSSRQRLLGLAREVSSHRFWTSTKGILTALAAIATVVSVTLKLVPTSEACPSNTAALSDPRVDEGTLREFLERTSTAPDPTGGYTPAELARHVRWASVAVSVVGHKGKYLTLKWSLVDARAPEADDLPTNRRAGEFRSPGCGTNAFREEVLLPQIPPGRLIYVAFDLVDEANESLPSHEVQTKPIQGAKTPG
jgi:hypothetical protein